MSDYSTFPPSLAMIIKAIKTLEGSTIPFLHKELSHAEVGSANEVTAASALAAALDVHRELSAWEVKIKLGVAVSPSI